MILTVRDEKDFNIRIDLNVNNDFEYIEVTVSVQNKKAHTCITKRFPAEKYSEAPAFYRQQEQFLFGDGEEV